MAEVLASYDAPVADRLGSYRARVVGRAAEDGMWEGWFEFLPADGDGEVLVGAVESRQPNRRDLAYWASGLTPVFVEGALHRARSPLTVRVRTIELPASDHPAEKAVAVEHVVPPGPEPVLDPFEIGERSLDILRQELTALNRPRLLNIVAAHSLNPGGEDLSWMSDAQLVTFVVTATEAQLLRARS